MMMGVHHYMQLLYMYSMFLIMGVAELHQVLLKRALYEHSCTCTVLSTFQRQCATLRAEGRKQTTLGGSKGVINCPRISLYNAEFSS